jgi:hypothetical protein
MFFLIFFTKIQDSRKGFLLAISIAFWSLVAVISYSNQFANVSQEKVDLIYCEAYDLGKQKFPYINPYVEKESSDAFIDAFREGYIKGFKE